MHDEDLEILNVALGFMEPELALVWREIHGHAHDGSGPKGPGKTFRSLAVDRGVPLATIRNRYRYADREICAHFARYYRRLLGIRGTADPILATPRKYVERRRTA